MYYHGYGDREKAQALLRALPAEKVANILNTDFSKAEEYCPQKIQIAEVIRKVKEDLA
jgi:predicted aldo/keto reductase-like oxidoreductase